MNCGLLMKPAANLKPPLNSPAWSINNQSTSAPLTLSSFSLGQSPLDSPMDQMHRCPVSASISSSSDLRLFIIIVVSGLVVVVWAEDHPGQQWLIVSANNCMPLSGPLQYRPILLNPFRNIQLLYSVLRPILAPLLYSRSFCAAWSLSSATRARRLWLRWSSRS